jgi:hypothetical protein
VIVTPEDEKVVVKPGEGVGQPTEEQNATLGQNLPDLEEGVLGGRREGVEGAHGLGSCLGWIEGGMCVSALHTSYFIVSSMDGTLVGKKREDRLRGTWRY